MGGGEWWYDVISGDTQWQRVAPGACCSIQLIWPLNLPPLNQIWQAPRASTYKTITGDWSTRRTRVHLPVEHWPLGGMMCASLLIWALLLIVNTLFSRQPWKHSRCLIGMLIIIRRHLRVCRQHSGTKPELLSDGAVFSASFLRLPILTWLDPCLIIKP